MQTKNDPVPDSNGNSELPSPLPLHPVPVDGSKTIDRILSAAALALGGGITLLLVLASQTRTMGATRSTKLKWEQRQQAINAAQYNADSAAEQSD